MKNIFAASLAAAAAGFAFGQSVEISAVVTSTDPFSPGDDITVELQYSQTGFGPGAGPAAIGIDIDVTDGGAGVATAITNVTTDALATGALDGTNNGLDIDRLVRGQPANVFNVNPAVLVDGDITFATLTISTDSNADCSGSPVVTITPSEATNGGVRVYDDATDQTAAGGANSLMAGVTYTAATVTCGGAPLACDGDTNGDFTVDGNDFVNFLVGFGTTSGATFADGDNDGNGTVDGQDFVLFLVRFGRTYDANCNII